MAGAPPHSLLRLLRPPSKDSFPNATTNAFAPQPTPNHGLRRLLRPAVPTEPQLLSGATQVDKEALNEGGVGDGKDALPNKRLPLSLLIGSKVHEGGKKLGEALHWLWTKRPRDQELHHSGHSKLKLALKAAKDIRQGLTKATKIEGDYLAASSATATASRLKTLWAFLVELGAPNNRMGWKCSPHLVKAVGSVLKAAGYKAAAGYLYDLKVKHIEEGFPWTDGLDHTFKRVKRALERDVGPSRKAMEVKEYYSLPMTCSCSP